MLLHEEEMIDKAWREEQRSKMTATYSFFCVCEPYLLLRSLPGLFTPGG